MLPIITKNVTSEIRGHIPVMPSALQAPAEDLVSCFVLPYLFSSIEIRANAPVLFTSWHGNDVT